MHRSGTSMIAHLLNICGLDLGPPERLLAPQGDNPLGFFENAEFLRINDALLAHFGGSWRNPPVLADGWEQDFSLAPLFQEARNLVDSFSQSPRWGWKDPRTTILIPFWKSLIPDLRFVICVRNPLEVAQSLGNRDGFSIEEGSNLWDFYMHSAIKDTGNASRVLTFYEDYFINSLEEIDRIIGFCSLQRPDDPSKLRDTVSRELRHYNAQIVGLLRDKAISTRQKVFYMGLRSLSMQISSPSMPESARNQLTSDALDRYAALFTELPGQEALRRLEIALVEKEGQLAALSDTIEQNNEQNYLVEAERNAVQTRLEAELADLTQRCQEQDRIIADRGEANARLEAELTDLTRQSREKDRLVSDRNEVQVRLEAELVDWARRGEEMDRLVADLGEAQTRLEAELADLTLRNEEKDQQLAEINFHFLGMQQTIGWRLLQRVRRVVPLGSGRRKLYLTFRRTGEVLLREGPNAAFRKAKDKIQLARRGQSVLVKLPPQEAPEHPPHDLNSQYPVWLEQHRLATEGVAGIRESFKTLKYTPSISIATPVYNIDEVWLRKAIDSVRAQIYPHWELCLVNDASTNPRVNSVLDEYAAADNRIKVKHLDRNEGIAGASNQALRLATGEFVGLLDHDDELSPDALFEIVRRLNEDPELDLLYSDEDKLELDGRRVEPFFKPDWSPDLLLSMNYITHFSVLRRSLLEEIGGFRLGYDGAQDWDLLLRFTERTGRIAHVPRILYHWRKIPGSAAASTDAKSYAYQAAQRAIEVALPRRAREGSVESIWPGMFMVRYSLRSSPLVSIIIPTRDRWQLLQQCIRSIEEKTAYRQYEIIVVDNGSTEPETLQYLDSISARCNIHQYPGQFNFAAINNFGAAKAQGEHLLCLNNDTQVIRPDWVTAMLEHSQQPEVGAVGAKLLYPDGRIQHAGVVVGLGGVAAHAFRHVTGEFLHSYYGFADVVRNCSAVTGACMMVSRRVFDEVGGFDEQLKVAYNDVDLCLRIRKLGYTVVYTPMALLYHHESASRGRHNPPGDEALFLRRWGDLIKDGDPYYNPNLTLSYEDWSLRV
jgi:GT2 family glycosyltransferase